MSSADEKNLPGRSGFLEALESPFLDREADAGQDREEWMDRVDAMQEQGAFASAFAEPWTQPEQSYELEEAGIVSGDNRVQAKDTTGVPWRWICKIRIEDSRGREAGMGTGVL